MPIDRVVLSIHGVESDGQWQDQIAASFAGWGGVSYAAYKYGTFDFWRAAFESDREKELVAFAKAWERSYRETDGVIPSIIAHSFGTWLVCTALLRFPAISFNRIILCGSIVDCDFDWPAIFAAGRVQAVLNETAGANGVVDKLRLAAAPMVIAGSGPSGVDGFTTDAPELEQRHHPHLTHSGALVLRTHCDVFWRPFIFDNVAFADACRRAQIDQLAKHELKREAMPAIREHLKVFFGDGGDSPYVKVMENEVFRQLVRTGVSGVLSQRQLVLAIVSALREQSE